jgi:hypothetical protein
VYASSAQRAIRQPFAGAALTPFLGVLDGAIGVLGAAPIGVAERNARRVFRALGRGLADAHC